MFSNVIPKAQIALLLRAYSSLWLPFPIIQLASTIGDDVDRHVIVVGTIICRGLCVAI